MHHSNVIKMKILGGENLKLNYKKQKIKNKEKLSKNCKN